MYTLYLLENIEHQLPKKIEIYLLLGLSRCFFNKLITRLNGVWSS